MSPRLESAKNHFVLGDLEECYCSLLPAVFITRGGCNIIAVQENLDDSLLAYGEYLIDADRPAAILKDRMSQLRLRIVANEMTAASEGLGHGW